MTFVKWFNHRPVIYSRVFKVDPSLPVGTVIDTLWARDEDRDQELRFYLAGNNTCTAFSVDSESGIIKVEDAAQLDYWSNGVDTFLLRVGVRDDDIHSLSDSTDILIVLKINTGIHRAILPNELGFMIYPNPAADELSIQLDDLFETGDISISIINLSGQTIWREDHRGGTRKTYRINLSAFPTGFYSVIVQTDKSKGVQRLVLIR